MNRTNNPGAGGMLKAWSASARRFFKSYIPLTRAGMQDAINFRVDFMFIILGCAVQLCILFFIWSGVFNSSGSTDFMGFTRPDMITYIFVAFLAGFLTYSDVMWQVGEEIHNGSIAMRILKPVSFNLTYLFQEFGFRLLVAALMILPIVGGVEVYRFFAFGCVQFNPAQFLVFIISVFMAFLILFFFNLCCAFLAFIFKEIWGVNMLKYIIVDFLSGALIPLAMLPGWAEKTLLILPFSSLTYTPVMIYMGRYTGVQALLFMGLQVFWMLFFIALAEVIWRIVIKHLCVQGG